jgi:hypothetical protein
MADPPGDGGYRNRIRSGTAPAFSVDVPPAFGVRAECPTARDGFPEVLVVRQSAESITSATPDLIESPSDRGTEAVHERVPSSGHEGSS